MGVAAGATSIRSTEQLEACTRPDALTFVVALSWRVDWNQRLSAFEKP